MSFIKRMLGKKKSSKKQQKADVAGDDAVAKVSATAATTIHELNGKVESLEKRVKHLQKRAAKEHATAQSCSKSGQRRKGLMALKKRNLLQKEVQKCESAMLTLQQQIIALEGSVVNTSVLAGMQTGASALASMNAAMSPDAAADLIDTIEDQFEVQAEIDAALGTTVGGPLEDDEELEDDFLEIQRSLALEAGAADGTAAATAATAATATATAATAAVPATAAASATGAGYTPSTDSVAHLVATMPVAPQTAIETAGATAAELAELAELEAAMCA